MNVFADINWDLPKLPGFLDDAYIQENSATYRLLKDQAKVYHSQPKDIFDDLEDDCTNRVEDKEDAISADEEPQEIDPALRKKKHIAGLVKGLPFPKYSNITKQEQELFLQLQSKFLHKKLTLSSSVKVEEQKDFSTFISLNNKVMSERAEFLEFLKERWPLHMVKHRVISTEIEQYTTKAWEHRLKYRLEGLMPFYNKTKTLPLVYQGNKLSVQLEPGTLLLQMGVVPLVIHPKFQYRVQISQSCEKLSKRCPPDCSDATDASGTVHKQPVSEDVNAEQLARAYSVDIVISSSGLKTIANNHPDFKNGWDLPIVVKEVDAIHGSGRCTKKRIAFVDKALPPRTMNVVDRNVWFHKFAAKSKWCHPKHVNAFKFPYQGKTSKPDITSTSSKNISNDGSSLPKEQKSKSPKKLSPAGRSAIQHSGSLDESSSGSNSSEDEETGGLLIDTDSCGSASGCRPANRKKRKTRVGRRTRSSAKTSLPLKRVEDEVEELLNTLANKGGGKSKDAKQRESNAKQASTEGTDVPPPEPIFTMPGPLANVNYRLWTLKKVPIKDELNQHMMKQPAANADRNLTLLVRNKLDGILRNQRSIVPVCVLPKLEYQSEYGGEKLTKEEATKEWVSLMFRQQSILARIRLDAETSEVLLMELRTLPDLLQDCRQACGHGFVADVTSTLYSVLGGLVDLPPGQYLLSHTKAMGSFALLQQGNQEFGSFNLKEAYSSVDPQSAPVPEEIPWQEIDMGVQMPYHVTFNRVTGTYYPVDKLRITAAPPPRKRIVGHSKKLLKKRRKKRREVKAARDRTKSGDPAADSS